MKKLSLLAFIFLVISCEKPEYKGEQCITDIKNNLCHCREYEFNIEHVGPTGLGKVNHPIEYCHLIIGFKDYVSVATFWEIVRREIKEGIE